MNNADMPAIPTITYDHGAAMQGLAVSVTDAPGLTKREMMAMHILCGMQANADINLSSERMAEESVKAADALLVALESI